MAECELRGKCVFFNDRMPASVGTKQTKEIIKKRYCWVDSSGCARYKVYLAVHKDRTKVPDDLFPNQFDRANDLISKARKQDESRMKYRLK